MLSFFFLLSDVVEYSLNLFAFFLKDLLYLLLVFFFSWNHTAWLLALQCAHQPFLLPLVLYLTYSTLPSSLCGFWDMLSSPTVILQPYGLPVYPQTTTCYPSIVQVNSHFTLQTLWCSSALVKKGPASLAAGNLQMFKMSLNLRTLFSSMAPLTDADNSVTR